MCRWLAYSGSPVLLRKALYTPAHSLIDQSLHSRMGAETTNGDGFGVGWYGARPIPACSTAQPAWNDHNLHELADHVSSGHFFTHIRAAIGSAVQQTNCHPFRHDRWLFMHNGYINQFGAIKRDLAFAVDPSLYPEIQGQTDSEVLFFLALTFGLVDDPPEAIARAIGLVEEVGAGSASRTPSRGRSPRRTARAYGRSGIRVRASRERSTRQPTSPRCVRSIPTRPSSRELSEDMRLVVSEATATSPGSGTRYLRRRA